MKFHRRIHRKNLPLLRTLPVDHPYVRLLQVHAESCDVCVGKEIDWPHVGIKGIDQTWISSVDGKRWTFSAIAYIYISYDLVIDMWLESAPPGADAKRHELDYVAKMRPLLDECEQAVIADENTPMVPLVAKAKEYMQAWDDALRFRFGGASS